MIEIKQAPDIVKESLRQVSTSGMRFPIIAIYDRASDYPGIVVARVFNMNIPTNIVVKYKNLKAARKDAQAAGFDIRLNRTPDDDPALAETYVKG